MKAKHIDIKLLARLSYDKETGEITNEKGNTLGHYKSDGYLYIHVGNRKIAAHRVAWVLVTGNQPVSQIDHINGNRSDNRWDNLRQVTNQQNQLNRPTTGITKVGSKWRARLSIDGKTVSLGTYECPVIAHLKYKDEREAVRLSCRQRG